MRATLTAVLLTAALAAQARGTYPQVDLAKQKKGTPTYAVAGFLSGWRKGDMKAMRPYVQLSTLEDAAMAKMALQTYLDSPLVGAKILKTTPIRGLEEMLADVRAQLWTKTAKGVGSHVWSFRVVRESKPRTPDPKGKWGVNPVASSRADQRG